MSDAVSIKVELFYDSTWQDITSYVDIRPGSTISITRGTQNEGTTVDPTSCTLTLNNTDGRFAPRNPRSPLFGKIGRNTLLRVTGPGGSVRFVGEVSAWPQAAPDTGTEVTTTIAAAGITRRLKQGQLPKQSGIRNYVTNIEPTNRSWPGDTLATSGGNGGVWDLVLDHCAANVLPGQGDLGDLLDKGLLIQKTNSNVGPFAPTSGFIRAPFLIGGGGTYNAIGFAFKSNGLGTLRLYTQGFGAMFPGGNGVFLDAPTQTVKIMQSLTDSSGVTTTVTLGSGSDATIFTDGEVHSLLYIISDIGAALTHSVYIDGTLLVTASDSQFSDIQGLAYGWLTYDPTTISDGTDVAVSYLTAWSSLGDPVAPDPTEWAEVVDGYVGELAGNRISRLCDENDIDFTVMGSLSDTIAMGVMGASDLTTVMSEAADADGGLLFEPRDSLGLIYRTRRDFYNQAAALTIDYTAEMLGSAPEVTDDDQNVTNDVTVSRSGGGSAEAVLESGALSVQVPPAGIDRYPTSVSVNVQSDEMLPDQASWRLAKGTIDEARWPSLHLKMMNPGLAADLAAASAIDVTSRLVITNPPAWLPPEDVNLLVQGYTETLAIDGWDITFNCTPESVYHVAVYGTDRFDAEDSFLRLDVSATDTALPVGSAANTQKWTTDPAAFPFDIMVNGERMTVTAITNITGSDQPQTFTVIRSVNGISKAQPSGAKVNLFKQARFAL